MNYQEFLEEGRKFRSKLFQPLGKFLLKLKLTPNQLSSLSFIFGLTAAFFLFQNHLLFTLFILLHLLTDSLDGVLARLTKPTLFGDYFDHINDQIVAFFLLFKIYLHLNDYYIIIVLFLFILTYSIYFLSQMKYPILFVRAGTAIPLLFYPLFPNLVPNGTYLVVGIFLLYSLLLQLRYFLRTRISPS